MKKHGGYHMREKGLRSDKERARAQRERERARTETDPARVRESLVADSVARACTEWLRKRGLEDPCEGASNDKLWRSIHARRKLGGYRRAEKAAGFDDDEGRGDEDMESEGSWA